LPKALCPVGGRPLVDHALDRLVPAVGTGPANLAVNAHHHSDLIVRHCRERAHVEVEEGLALGTAGALAGLRPWLDGRPALVTNADSYLPGGLPDFTDGWDGERCRLLCLPTSGRPDFTASDGAGLKYVGACLLPWARIRDLALVPSGLYEVLWRAEAEAGALDLFALPPGTTAIDCGTPADYLAANRHAEQTEQVTR
jgi:NDP-sugar pyrophosphorylase family protein